jgi:hypothetical protein
VSSGERKALIIACDKYEQAGLRHLLAPAADAEALSVVLGDPDIGGFAVEVVYNQPSHITQAQIENFLSQSRPEDILLLHFSCHGLKSESGELFFAARNTRPNLLRSTAIPAGFVQQCMRTSRSRSIVLLLDCCYGAAFSQGVTVRATEEVNVLDAFSGGKLGGGRGRAVITASSAMEYAFEGDRLANDRSSQPSVFTRAVVEGLGTGDADRDEDGWISLSELYDYVFDKVREQNPHQTPSRDFEMQGEMYIARSRRQRVEIPPFPPDLDAAARDKNIYTRRGAVIELGSRLLSDNLAAAAGACAMLTELANDVDYVADEARAALHEVRVHPAETELRFGRLVRGSPSPHLRIHLLGPPIARACRAYAPYPWVLIQETTDGFDVSIDTAQVGKLEGFLTIKGPTGEAAVTIDANVVPSVRHPRRSTMVLSFFWALLPTLTIGVFTPLLAPIPFAHAAARFHERRLWFIACAYGVGSLMLWILWIVAISEKWTAASLVFYFAQLTLGVVATVHAFKLRRLVFAASSPPTAADSGSPMPSRDDGPARVGGEGNR